MQYHREDVHAAQIPVLVIVGPVLGPTQLG
jgi:hypothetical protein